MDTLIIPKTESTPEVELNEVTHKFSISGESRPENVKLFYEPLFDWFGVYFNGVKSADKKQPVNLEIYFDYFNSTTGKVIHELINKLNLGSTSAGVGFKVIWKYNQFDEDLLESGNELAKLLEVPFEFIPMS